MIKVKEAAVSTAGGLFIPDNAKGNGIIILYLNVIINFILLLERPTEGLVIAAGPGRIHPETAVQMDMAAKVGESVVYGKYDGSELKYNDVNHQMIKDDDILFKYQGTEMKLDLINCVKDQVLIRLPPKEEAASSGIILSTPGDKEKKPDHGTVVKIGPGRQAGNGKYMPIQVEPNDKVKFRSFAGNEIKIQGIDYIVVRAYDILAKWK